MRIERNYFIFVDRIENFAITMKHLVYGANISRPEHRALCNVKPGDIVFIYVMDERCLYGPFVAESRVFYDEIDIGWRKDGAITDWYYRVPLRPWMNRIGVLDRYSLSRVYRSIKKSLYTLRDIDDLHRRYLNTLLRDEGVVLLREFIRNATFKRPVEISDQFGTSPLRKEPLNAKNILKGGNEKEYAIELYLLQNFDKLSEIVGFGFTEVYNQLYVYQNRFLDLLILHRSNDDVIKATVVEIKRKPTISYDEMLNALDALSHYMTTVADWLNLPASVVHGVLLTPDEHTTQSTVDDVWRRVCDEVSQMYSIPSHTLISIQYKVNSQGDLEFK